MARKKTAPAQIKIRLPDALRRDLEREAAKSGRTLNGEIVHRLTQPFVQADRKAVASQAAQEAVEATREILLKMMTDQIGWDASKFLEAIKPTGQGDKS